MKVEQRKYWEEAYHVPNDIRCYRENGRWIMPVAMRAVSSHNLESRHTDKNEDDFILNPRVTSHEIADNIAILGGSFHVTTLAKLPSIVKTKAQEEVHSSITTHLGTRERPQY